MTFPSHRKKTKTQSASKKADWVGPALAVFIKRPQADRSNRRYRLKVPPAKGKVKSETIRQPDRIENGCR
jgi:hypothetical protein